MLIMFHGQQTAEEASDSLLSIIQLFKDRYGISNFREVNLDVTLLDHEGQDIELVDSTSSEVLGVFEVYKSGEGPIAKNDEGRPFLKLVVDNTK